MTSTVFRKGSLGSLETLSERHLNLAVRETGISRHQGGLIEGPLETPRTSLYYRIEWLKGDLKGNATSNDTRHYDLTCFGISQAKLKTPLSPSVS